MVREYPFMVDSHRYGLCEVKRKGSWCEDCTIKILNRGRDKVRISTNDIQNAKSLAQIFTDNGNATHSIKVQQVCKLRQHGGIAALGTSQVPMILIGIDEEKNVAFCHTEKTPDYIIRRTLDKNSG